MNTATLSGTIYCNGAKAILEKGSVVSLYVYVRGVTFGDFMSNMQAMTNMAVHRENMHLPAIQTSKGLNSHQLLSIPVICNDITIREISRLGRHSQSFKINLVLAEVAQ